MSNKSTGAISACHWFVLTISTEARHLVATLQDPEGVLVSGLSNFAEFESNDVSSAATGDSHRFFDSYKRLLSYLPDIQQSLSE